MPKIVSRRVPEPEPLALPAPAPVPAAVDLGGPDWMGFIKRRDGEIIAALNGVKPRTGRVFEHTIERDREGRIERVISREVG